MKKDHTVQFPESSVRTARAVGGIDTTGQIVMQTRVETRSFNDSHTFSVSKSVEFFLKFEVPEKQIAALEADPERHIFQVVGFPSLLLVIIFGITGQCKKS